MTDLVIRGGIVVDASERRRVDVSVEDGRVAALGVDLPGGRVEVDATGLLVLPALIDVHLHFNEPGRTQWEGAASGSRALAVGGGAVFFDMPLNSTPCTVNAREVERKRAALEASSIADFGLWGGLVPGSVGDMTEMAEAGVVGFKAFMCQSGLPEFPRADDVTLHDGMREAARLKLPVAVHAESEELTSGLLARMSGRTPRDFLASRPVLAEVEAIQRATLIAEDTGAALHIVHVSSGRGVAAAAAARARGVDVSIETCPHYLFFTDEDFERIGVAAKCAPPLRSSGDREDLWRRLVAGTIDIVASDHSPCEPAMKAGDVVSAWGGIAGVQSTLHVLAGGDARGLTVERLVAVTSTTPARRFRLSQKGVLAPGYDADIVLVDPGTSFTLQASDLHQRHALSPYVGAQLRARVRRTVRRGETIAEDGRITATTPGRFVRPSPL